jgi:hypothetical protein
MWLMRVFAASMLLVGFMHAILGMAVDEQLGAVVALSAASDPVLDSQNRFFGTLFMGYGAFLLLSLQDLQRYAAVFRIVAAFIALGGVARILSIALVGLPTPPVLALVAVEVALVPLLVWWHARLLVNR